MTTRRGGVPYDRGAVMPDAIDTSRLGIFGALYFVATTLITNIAVGLVAVGAALGAAAFMLWLHNRDSLRQLDAILHDKAHAGLTALQKAGSANDDGT